jgi:hypothetical protein
MPATPPNQPTDYPPSPDPHLDRSMQWVTPIWLIAFLTAVVFGIITYIVGLWVPRG